MSCIDLVSGLSYIQVNKKLVKLVGLYPATYWAQVLDIATKVVKKNTVDTEGYWKIDREYVEEQLGMSLEDQLNCDAILQSLGILEVNPVDPCKLGIKVEDYIRIITDSNIKQIDAAKKKAKLTKAEAKKKSTAGKIITMQKLVSESDPDIRSSYESWVESVYEKGGYLTKVKIQIFEDTVNKFATDKSTKLGVLREAILSGFDNPDWVIERYTKSNKNNSVRLSDQKVSTGISTEWEF